MTKFDNVSISEKPYKLYAAMGTNGSSTYEIPVSSSSSANKGYIGYVFNADEEDKLKRMFVEEYFCNNRTNPSEYYFRELFSSCSLGALVLISKIYHTCDTRDRDNTVEMSKAVGVLRMIANFSYEEMYWLGHAIAIDALTSNNPIINDYGVQCFDSWEHPDSIVELEKHAYASEAVREYVADVILSLKEKKRASILSEN